MGEIGGPGGQNRMGRVLRVLGIIFCITLALGIVGFAVLAHYGNKLDAETQRYVDQTVPLIVGRWDVAEFMERVSPEFLKVAPRSIRLFSRRTSINGNSYWPCWDRATS